MTSEICELVVGNMDANFSRGVVVGHACGEVNADVFVLFFCHRCVFVFSHSSHSCPKLSCPFLCQQKVFYLYISCQSNQAYNMSNYEISFMTTI